MILLITGSARAQECAAAIREATGEEMERAESRQRASAMLRIGEYAAVVIDQCLLEPDADTADEVLLHDIGTGIPVYVNLAISGSARVAREIRAALQRRERERSIAQRAAETTLRNQLKGNLTALLLSCQMAMAMQGLPAAALARIKSIHEAAQEIRSHLALQESEPAVRRPQS